MTSASEFLTLFAAWQQKLYPGLASLQNSLVELSPWQHLLTLDGPTRLAVILSLILCAYIVFNSVLRCSRMIMSLVLFIVQLLLVIAVVFIAMRYKDNVGGAIQSFNFKDYL